MKLFKATFGAVSYVVAAESESEIAAHTHADKIEPAEAGEVVPLPISALPVVAAPVAPEGAPDGATLNA